MYVILAPFWGPFLSRKLMLFYISFWKILNISWDILQKSTSCDQVSFSWFFEKNMENEALACMAAPKRHFRCFQKLLYFHRSNIDNRAFVQARASILRCFITAKIARIFDSIFRKCNFPIIKCTIVCPNASKTASRTGLRAPSSAPGALQDSPGPKWQLNHIKFVEITWKCNFSIIQCTVVCPRPPKRLAGRVSGHPCQPQAPFRTLRGPKWVLKLL